MSPAMLRSILVRAVARDRLTIVMTLIIYPAMIAWSALAVGPVSGPAIMLPTTLVAGAWIWSRVRRRMRKAEAALHGEADLATVCAERLDQGIKAKRFVRSAAPALVVLSLGSAAIVVGRHGNAIYWAGAVSVGALLLLGAIRAHLSLSKDVALRATVR
jgi:hypothetical protein